MRFYLLILLMASVYADELEVDGENNIVDIVLLVNIILNP